MLRKITLFLLICLFLSGCATARQSEVSQHSAMYQSWGHLWFSWYGYKNRSCDPAVQARSQQERWWGTEVGCR
jgi:uncharacterized protein YceK